MTIQEGAGQLLATVRDIHRSRRSGVLELPAEGGSRKLYFQEGQLHLPQGHPLASQVEELLVGEESFGTREVQVITREIEGTPITDTTNLWPPRARRSLRALVGRIALFLGKAGSEGGTFVEASAPSPRELVGPLPTADLLMEMAVAGKDAGEILHFLGGEDVPWICPEHSPEIPELWLEPSEGFLLSRLDQPTRLAELVRQMALPRKEVLEDLARLYALGLIASAEERDGEQRKPKGTTITTSLREVFLNRVATDLQQNPLELDAEEHRAQIAEMLRQLGEWNLYQLLQISPGATSEDVHAAYQLRARLVHPLHGEKLQLPGQGQVLDLLFERATEAYATLSDPTRRDAYNQEQGIQSFRDLDATEKRQRDHRLAREHFETAQRRFAQEDYHNAYVLLRESLRLHPKAESFALLGQVEMQNPNWHRYAVETFRKAVDLEPDSIEFRFLLADACEQLGMKSEAKLNYEDILERQPGHATAQEALARMAGKKVPAEGKKKGGFLGRLLKRDSDKV